MRTKKQPLRRSIQIVTFLLILLVSVVHTLGEADTTFEIPFIDGASLHAICPFGGVVSLYTFFTEGTFLQKIHQSSFVLMILVFLTALLFGPVFCGWICPFGTFQEFISSIGRKLFKKRFNSIIPKRIDRVLRYTRYLVLIWVVVVSAYSVKLMFSDYDPYYALFNFWTGEVALSGFIILGLVIAASLVIERPFCKYACPYGALLGITNIFRMFGIKRNVRTCISCKKCDSACPMNIHVSTSGTVRDHQCITCMACTQKRRNELKKIRQNTLAIIVLVIIFGGILGSRALGLWLTESTKIPRVITEGDFAGSYDPADIRGSYSFGDIERSFALPAETLKLVFAGADYPVDASAILAKDLEEMYAGAATDTEVGTDSLRLFVAYYMGIPYDPTETTILPTPAVEYLHSSGKLQPDEYSRLMSSSIPTPDLTDSAALSSDTAPDGDQTTSANITHTESEEMLIKGKTTFADLLGWGLDERSILDIIESEEMPGRAGTVRQYCLDNAIEFEPVKTALQELIDKL